MRVSNPFLGVIADFSLYESEGLVVLRPKPSRVERLVESLQPTIIPIADDFLPAAEADALAVGRTGWGEPRFAPSGHFGTRYVGEVRGGPSLAPVSRNTSKRR
eukprot:scaffold7536_cov154-Isochrysis_galbana.AAC.2